MSKFFKNPLRAEATGLPPMEPTPGLITERGNNVPAGALFDPFTPRANERYSIIAATARSIAANVQHSYNMIEGQRGKFFDAKTDLQRFDADARDRNLQTDPRQRAVLAKATELEQAVLRKLEKEAPSARERDDLDATVKRCAALGRSATQLIDFTPDIPAKASVASVTSAIKDISAERAQTETAAPPEESELAAFRARVNTTADRGEVTADWGIKPIYLSGSNRAVHRKVLHVAFPTRREVGSDTEYFDAEAAFFAMHREDLLRQGEAAIRAAYADQPGPFYTTAERQAKIKEIDARILHHQRILMELIFRDVAAGGNFYLPFADIHAKALLGVK